MLILSVETSCDDTSVAIVDSDYKVLSECSSSQLVHNEYGGVVPEIASRMHIKAIMRLTEKTLQQAGVSLNDIDAVATSVNPGLIGSLLIGVSYAKALAYSLNKPFIAVNHLLGHIYANRISTPDLSPPFLALVVSGGHTELVDFSDELTFKIVGKTCDDAAGEAFDKTAKILGLGYPGGPVIDKLSRNGDPDFVRFPQALNKKKNYNFSYSGLKTAVVNYLANQDKAFIEANVHSIAASVQKAIVEPLVKKTINYLLDSQDSSSSDLSSSGSVNRKIVLAGGVAANGLLRKMLSKEAEKRDIKLYIPPLQHCMDNASMIGAAAVINYRNKNFASLDFNPFSTKGTRYISC